jgi:hypothetical protein
VIYFYLLQERRKRMRKGAKEEGKGNGGK